jgi:hypothetical protein
VVVVVGAAVGGGAVVVVGAAVVVVGAIVVVVSTVVVVDSGGVVGDGEVVVVSAIVTGIVEVVSAGTVVSGAVVSGAVVSGPLPSVGSPIGSSRSWSYGNGGGVLTAPALVTLWARNATTTAIATAVLARARLPSLAFPISPTSFPSSIGSDAADVSLSTENLFLPCVGVRCRRPTTRN